MENDRKTQIIKTAVKRFARHGLNKTTLTEIARDLRIGKATIYHYFASKEDLFYQAMQYDFSLFIEDIKQILNNEQAALNKRFVEYFNCKQEVYNKYNLLYNLLIRVLKEEESEREKEIIKVFFENEKKVIKDFINCKENNIQINPGISDFIVIQSWGFMLGKKLNDLSGENAAELNLNELILESLDGIIK